MMLTAKMERKIYAYNEVRYKNRAIEVLIAIAISFSPFTKLRVAGIGITEVILLLLPFYSMLVLKDAKVTRYDNQVSRMYFFIICGSILGYIYNILFLGNIGEFDSARFNFISYLICMVCCYGIESCLRNRVIDPLSVLDKSFWLLSIIATILFAISRTRSSFNGFSLLYYSYYCPLSDNIHQLAMIFSMFPALGIYLSIKRKTIIMKVLYIIISVVDIYIGLNTGSTKFVLGLIVGGISILLLFVINSSAQYKFLITSIIVVVSIVIFVLNYDIFVAMFRGNDVHSGRETLYGNGLQMILKSPIFGYGPAVVVTGVYGMMMDAHETIITAYLAGGVIAFVSLLSTMYKKFVVLLRDKWLFGSMCGFLIYFLGGDVLRKECMWVMLILATNIILDKEVYDYSLEG